MLESSDQIVSEIRQAIESPAQITEQERERIIKELQSFSKEFQNLHEVYMVRDDYVWLTPAGGDGRTWDEEMDYAQVHREDGYIPQITYPLLARGYSNDKDPEGSRLDIDGGLSALDELADRLEEKYGSILPIVGPAIEKKRREFQLLQAVKNGDQRGAVENMPHDFPSLELIDYARSVYEQRLTIPVSEIERRLQSQKFSAADYKNYLEYALRFIEDGETVKVEITDKVSSLTFEPDKLLMSVPLRKSAPGQKDNGVQFLGNIGHEPVHIMTALNAKRNGFGTMALGAESEVLQEGLAKVIQKDAQELFLGYRPLPEPYYVLAMQEARQNHGDFWATYDFLYRLREAEFRARGKDERYIAEETPRLTRNIIRRIFRGSTTLDQVGLGGDEIFIYTKDKAYIEGEMIAEKIKAAGLLYVVLAGKFDLEAIIFALHNNVIPREAMGPILKLEEKVWGKEGDREFLLKPGMSRFYGENYNEPYWQELGIADEEYVEGWTSGRTVKPKVG